MQKNPSSIGDTEAKQAGPFILFTTKATQATTDKRANFTDI